MTQIRNKYLKDSTVTIVLMGSCTHSRRYVDWEIKSSLRQGENIPNGLLGILLPSQNDSAYLPQRFEQNLTRYKVNCYAKYRENIRNQDSSWENGLMTLLTPEPAEII